jgi:hypothetical protein
MAEITTLIDKQDTSEIVRDQLAAILRIEAAAQQALAVEAGKDPGPWTLRVFLERSNPWEEFQEPSEVPEEDPPPDVPPIVNVSFDAETFDLGASNVVERQKATATYNVDCYGYGVAADDPDGGHRPGDEDASIDCQRAVRLVRNILMAGPYTYLGLRGMVWRRFIQSVTMFQPTANEQPVQQVKAARIAVQVEFSELAPQVVGAPLELVSVQVRRAETGEIFLTASYGGEV